MEEIDLSKIEEVFTTRQSSSDHENIMVEYKKACDEANEDEKIELGYDGHSGKWSITVLKSF